MSFWSDSKGTDWVFELAIALFLVSGLILLPHYQYKINPDSIAYINIARNYLVGNWSEAVNGYWGPVYSWLMVPFLHFGIEPLAAAKILALGTGVLTLFLLKKLINSPLAYIAIIPILLYQSFYVINPDFLIVPIFFSYLILILGEDFGKNKRKGILCGILGGVGYLTKAYFFYFFIFHFSLIMVYRYWESKQKQIILNTIFGLLACIAIAVSWGVVLGVKYGHFTLGTAGGFNHALARTIESKGYPMYYRGLVAPPNETAASAWEEPILYKLDNWNPLSSWINLKTQLKISGGNIAKTGGIIQDFTVFAAAIISGVLLSSFRKNLKGWLMLATAAIYAGGYSLITVEARYLWPIQIILLIMGLDLIKMVKPNKRWLSLVLCLSFVVLPLKEMRHDFELGKGFFTLSQRLERELPLKGAKVASDANWDTMDFLAYYLDYRYYGQTVSYLGKEIEYYFVWEKDEFVHPDYKKVSSISLNGAPVLKIYKRND